MNHRQFKVIGVQLMPKNILGTRPFFQQIADKEIPYIYRLFEKMVLPVNKEFEERLKYEDFKKRSSRKFMVVGLFISSDNPEKHDGLILLNGSKFQSMNVFNELESLVRIVN